MIFMELTCVFSTKIIEISEVSSIQNKIGLLLSPDEIFLLGKKIPTKILLAKRLAAKQALAECLLQINIIFDNYSSVSILHDDWGKPYFSFSESLNSQLQQRYIRSILLSIADEKKKAYAYVLVSKVTKDNYHE